MIFVLIERHSGRGVFFYVFLLLQIRKVKPVRRNYFSRMIAMTLSGILAFSNVDVTVFASENGEAAEKTITAFEELDDDIAHQAISVGASEENIIFPDSLSVTVTYQEEKETKKKIEPSEDKVLPEDKEKSDEEAQDPDKEIIDSEKDTSSDETGDDAEPGSEIPSPEDPQNPEPAEPKPSQDPGYQEPSGDDEPADNASDPSEGDDTSGDDSNDENSGSDESLFGMIFPATKAYAASAEDLDDEDEEQKELENDEAAPAKEPVEEEADADDEEEEDEDKYEIVKELVTITEDITIEDFEWELDKEESSFDEFSSDEAGAKFIYVPAFSDEYEVDEDTDLPTITVTIVKEAAELEYMVLEEGGVRVEGNLPVGTKLVVSPIEMSEAIELLDDPGKEIVFALDISLELDGEVIEPDDTVKVTINPPVDESVLKDDEFELIHVVDEDNKNVMDTQVSSQGELVFETEGFTPFLGAVSAGSYDVEFAQGKSFSQSVRVNFRDASLIKAGESYVVLQLVGNMSGDKVVKKKDDGTETNEPFVIDESDPIIINGVTDDGEGNTTAYEDYTFENVDVYVNRGTGDAMAGGNGTYAIPSDFYGIQITTVEGYSVSQGATGSDTYYTVTTTKDLNDAAWTTSRITIENNALAMTKPFFTIDWQDNRNYADQRPFTAGTSIDGQTDAIKATISLYYKDGDGYHEVGANSPILAVPGSNVPSVEGGPFSWKISYKNLPRYQEGETAYHWYVKLSDSFYDGKRAYYNPSGFNSDGYFEITESESESKPKLTMVFTDGVTGTIDWRVGSETEVIPQIPQAGLYSDANNTLKLYQKVGDGAPTLVSDSAYTVVWTEGQDSEGNVTWNYNIKGLPIYASNGDGILYYTVMESTAGTRFKYSYDNGEDSTETDKCLSGQKIYATLIGDGTFSFTKKWYDDGDSDSIARRALAISKGITFYLWRYPSNKTIADGAPVTNNAKQFSYTLTAGQENQDELTIALSDFASAQGVPNFEFPKYDEKGYTYVYYATEVSKSELYKTVYWNSAQEFTGTSSDKCVYNEGSICNVRSAKIAPGVTKHWSVSAVSDYVGSSCTFTLQRKEKNGEWDDKDTVILSGFSSSKKRVSGGFTSQELYDALGQRYEYRVIESAVTSGSGADAEFDGEGWTTGATGSCSAVYTMNDYTYKAVSTYTSTVENGVESAQALVTNKLYGTKKLSITKSWAGAWNIGTNDDKSGDITIQLNRAIESGASALYATIVMRKPSAGTQGAVTVTYEETHQTQNITHQVTNEGKTWTMEEIEVPAYTEDGRQYVYSLNETGVDSQDQELVYSKEYDRSVDGKKINLYVTNRIGSQTVETRIDVKKVWKDDSDSSQRSDVKIEFGTYDNAHIFTPVKNAQDEPYVLILTASRDYSYYKFVDGANFAQPGEDRLTAISKHLAIRASLKDPRTGQYTREMEQCTYSEDESGCVISGYIPAIVDNDNGFYRPGYSVSIYRAENGRSFVITNTRAASRAFTFTKNWQDSANALRYRGDFLRVALFREVNDVEKEIALIDIPTYTDNTRTELTSGDALTVTFTNSLQYYPAYDENGNNYIYSLKEYVCTGNPQSGEVVFIDGDEPDTGSIEKKEISLTATKDTTTTGYVATREMGETTYTPIDGEFDIGSRGVGSILMTESYTYTNTAAGEREEVPFYVIWHDGAKSNERPDIYLTLYYDGGENGKLIPYTGTYTERWEDVEPGNKFIQKAIFSGLPAAASDGRVYTYYVTEYFNNATTKYTTEHYTEALRNSDDTDYNSSAVRSVTIGTDNQLIVQDGLTPDGVEADGHKLTKEKSFTLTSISDEVKIEGRKLWLGIPDGIDVGKLPKAHIYLFRTSAYDKFHEVPNVSPSASQDEKMAVYESKAIPEIEDGDGSKSPQSLNETRAMYVYGTYKEDGTVNSYAKFPKYDAMGYLYTYSVREVIYNTLLDENELPADIMYPIYSDNTTDLSNQYKLDVNKNKRKFVVHKQWNIPQSSYLQIHAKATFRLYRLELNSDGHGYEALHYADNDADTSDPASSAAAAGSFVGLSNPNLELLDEKVITSNGESITSITWDNYPIFAPSGKIYAYYAVELTADMPGYTVALNGNNPENTTAEGSGAKANNTIVTGGSIATGDSYVGIAFANSGINLSESSETNKKEEVFRNTYNPTGFNSITFVKEWDNKGFAGMLPTISDAKPALKFNVYAIANTQSGKENKDTINFAEGTNYDVSVQLKDGDPAKWEYTITFKGGRVPIYSANGNLYTYYVKEILNSPFVSTNYQPVASLTYAKADTVNGTVLELPTHLKNTLKGSFAVQKMWDDFSNDYGMREGSVTFDVYYCIGSDGSWTKLNADNSPYSLSSANKWKQTVSGLPVTANASGDCGNNYQYRVWEKEIKSGATVIAVPEPDENDHQETEWVKNNHEVDSDKYFEAQTAGNYQVYNPKVMESIAGSPTKKLANQLDTSRAIVSLEVEKTWNDGNNLYGIRPASVWVTIQSSKNEGSSWENVTTREITSADADPSHANVWRKTFENLPKYYDGTSTDHVYKYRAIETKVGTTATNLDELTLTGTGGSYSISHDMGEKIVSGNVTFTTAVTNALIPMGASIKVLKRWNSAQPQGEVKVALFSTNFTGGAAGSGTPTEISFTGNETALNAGNNWTCTYTGLPKYNKDGRAIVYYVKEKTTGNFKTQYLSGTDDWPTGPADDDLKSTPSDITSDFYVVAVNTPLASVTGSKIWQDENNKYSLRPDKVELTLQRRTAGTEEDWVSVTYDDAKRTGATGITKGTDNYAKATVTAAGNWASVTVDKLPLYALSDGTTSVKYQYRLAELTVPNAYTRKRDTAVGSLTPNDGYVYGGTDSAQTSTVTNYLITRGAVTVNKVWNTLSDSDKKQQVTVKLLSGNLGTGSDSSTLVAVPGATANISGTGWSHEFTGLPAVNKSGTEIVYYVEEETVSGYDTAYYVQNGSSGYTKVDKAAAKTSTTDAFTFRIVNTPLTAITGSKVWSDENDAFKLRPTSIDLTLQRRTGTNAWQDVPVEEIRKTNPDTTVTPVVTISAQEQWKATIDKLPAYVLSDGSSPVKYQYRFAESNIPGGYTRDLSKEESALSEDDGYVYGTDTNGQTSTVTNHLILRSEPITVRKIWNTDETDQKDRVEVKLLSRNFTNGTDSGSGDLTVVKKGTESYVRTLDASCNWESIFENLPLKNKDGQDIVYYISETAGTGFAIEYYVFDGSDFNKVSAELVKSNGNEALLTQIVNTPKTSATVEKRWSDQDNKFATRPASIYVKLQRKPTDETDWADVTGQAIVELSDSNNWSETIDDLELFKEYSGADPVRYEYRFIETDAAGNPYVPLGYSLVSGASEYVMTCDGTEAGYDHSYTGGAYKSVITNTLITKSVTAIKKWEDDSDAHKIRPAAITLYVDGSGHNVLNNGARCTNTNLGVAKQVSAGGNIWTYVFTGLPKYAYDAEATATNPAEITYEVTEDVTNAYPGGFVIENYYMTTYEINGETTTITNTAMESDGVLLVKKVIATEPPGTNYGFPFKVSLTRPDNTTVAYTGRYYLYDASLGPEDIRNDVKAAVAQYQRIELTTSDGVIRVPSGKVAALKGINSMYRYTVTESPNHAGYEVESIAGAGTSDTHVADEVNGGFYGKAEGQIPSSTAPAVMVVFTNKLIDFDSSSYLKVENVTDPATNSRGEVLTGGEVKVYSSGTAVVSNDDIGDGCYDYHIKETHYIEQAMSVEFHPDITNGYSYAKDITICWWENGEDPSGEPHSVVISGFFYTDATGQHPYTGKLSKDGQGNITVEKGDGQFASVWSPLLANSPFKHVTVLEGSVVVTLASQATEMPPKTLVQVEFLPPATPAPSHHDHDSDSSSSQNNENTSAVLVATAATSEADKLKGQAGSDGAIQGVRTGDDTPLTALMMLFMTFALCFAAVAGKYMRMKQKKVDGRMRHL